MIRCRVLCLLLVLNLGLLGAFSRSASSCYVLALELHFGLRSLFPLCYRPFMQMIIQFFWRPWYFEAVLHKILKLSQGCCLFWASQALRRMNPLNINIYSFLIFLLFVLEGNVLVSLLWTFISYFGCVQDILDLLGFEFLLEHLIKPCFIILSHLAQHRCAKLLTRLSSH